MKVDDPRSQMEKVESISTFFQYRDVFVKSYGIFVQYAQMLILLCQGHYAWNEKNADAHLDHFITRGVRVVSAMRGYLHFIIYYICERDTDDAFRTIKRHDINANVTNLGHFEYWLAFD